VIPCGRSPARCILQRSYTLARHLRARNQTAVLAEPGRFTAVVENMGPLSWHFFHGRIWYGSAGAAGHGRNAVTIAQTRSLFRDVSDICWRTRNVTNRHASRASRVNLEFDGDPGTLSHQDNPSANSGSLARRPLVFIVRDLDAMLSTHSKQGNVAIATPGSMPVVFSRGCAAFLTNPCRPNQRCSVELRQLRQHQEPGKSWICGLPDPP
jgi:hypothetical protein